MQAPDASPLVINAELDRSVYGSGSDSMILRTILSCEEAGADAPRANADVVLVVDRSGSMRPVMPQVSIACEFLYQAWSDKPGRLGVLAFDDDVERIRNLEPVSSATLGDDLRRLQTKLAPKNCTNLCEALTAGLDMLQDSPERRPRALIVLSDGKATIGTTDSRAILCITSDHASYQSGAMLFSIAIGDNCDTTLLQKLSTDSSGGSLFEISRMANPAPVIGSLAGLIAFQRLQQVQVRISSTAGGAPADIGGLPTEEADEGSLCYTIGNLAAGERRAMLSRIPLPRETGTASVRIQVTAFHAIYGVSQQGRKILTAHYAGPDTPSSPQLKVVQMELSTARGMELLRNQVSVEAISAFLTETRELVRVRDEEEEKKEESDLTAARERLHQLRTRLSWYVELDGNMFEQQRLLRTTTTEVSNQRLTTHQATQQSIARDDDDDGKLPAISNIPGLCREMSDQATSYSQQHSEPEGAPMPDSLPLSRRDGVRTQLTRSNAMGEAALMRALAASATDAQPRRMVS